VTRPSAPRWRKVWRDLVDDRARTALVVLALAVSTAAVGTVASAGAVLDREIRRSYAGTQPASATLEVSLDRSTAAARGLDAEVAADVERLPGVLAAEARATVTTRSEVSPDEWRTLVLFAAEDLPRSLVRTVTPERGAAAPGAGEVLLERSGLPVLGRDLGDRLTVAAPGGGRVDLAVTGVVHDPAQSPGWMDGVGYGYVSPATLTRLGGPGGLDELSVVVAEPDGSRASEDPERIEAVARSAADRLGALGFPVSGVQIPPPGEHPHQAQTDALVVLLGVFSGLALVLSGLLAASLVSSLMARQVRWIGVMKAVGATTGQVAGMYATLVLALAGAALVVAVPAGLAGGRLGAAAAADLLNLDLAHAASPGWVVAVQVVAGLAVPLLVTSGALARAARTTVRESLADRGPDTDVALTGGAVDRLRRSGVLDGVRLLAVRNALRGRRRLTRTLATLVVAGAVVMTALSVTAAWSTTLDRAFEGRDWDLDVRLARPAPAADVLAVAEDVPGVSRVEAWGYAPAARKGGDGLAVVGAYPGEVHGALAVLAPPGEGRLVGLPVVAGESLPEAAGGEGPAAAVVNEAFLEAEAGLGVGDPFDLTIDGRASTWRLAGVVEELAAPATVYATQRALAAATGTPDVTSALRVVTTDEDPATRRDVSRRLERALADADVEVTAVQRIDVLRTSFDRHITILVGALLAVAAVVAAVGSLGLASATSIAVLERRRELGVLRAVGASRAMLVRLVTGEALVVGLLSWAGAVLLSLPLAAVVGVVAGQVGLGDSLAYAVSGTGIVLWLVLALVLAWAASAAPARAAARRPARHLLSYE
jgi:putative ABC transport system permease protein